ncbi:MAG: uroporphyrinogen decarboxylase [Phycisphaerales bacterium]|nr:uroporphyrinogen decarboxylase [Phycisphaerales bacterium]
MTPPLLLRVLQGELVDRPPVWLMRQAGRYLPEYQVLKQKYDFFTRVQTPALACAITMQPIKIIHPDAAIIFSDILVVPQAMGMVVEMHEGKGPLLPNPITSVKDINQLNTTEASIKLSYVYEALTLTRKELDKNLTLIGFAGAPWTVFCYMIEGKGSKTFDRAKSFCYQERDRAHQLLQKITQVTIEYLTAQIKAGADCVQLFDSWAGLLDKKDFLEFSLPYMNQIVTAIKPFAPIILFAKGVIHSLSELCDTKATALGIDWTITPQQARNITRHNIILQGNYDPAKLFQDQKNIQQDIKTMIQEFGKDRYIANLGHGLLPQTPVDNVRCFVDTVKNFGSMTK